jgi:glycerol-3-phosphate acyltransferase PlsY
MWLPIIITLVVGYLLGNINGSILVSKLIVHDDVRKHGSGNAGLTNFFRSYGGWNTLLVAAIDIGKAVAACLIGGFLLKSYGYFDEGKMLGAVAVSLGHDFPALLKFKGGKGIMSGFAVALVIDWRVGLLIFAVFALFYGITKYVSLGSILGAATFAIGFIVLHHDNLWLMLGGIFLGALAIFMHRANLMRLIKGTESKVYLTKKGRNK